MTDPIERDAIALSEKRLNEIRDDMIENCEENTFALGWALEIEAVASTLRTRAPSPELGGMVVKVKKLIDDWLSDYVSHLPPSQNISECIAGLYAAPPAPVTPKDRSGA